MQKFNSSLILKRDLWGGGYCGQYDLSMSAPLDQETRFDLARASVTELIPAEALHERIITDVKGRDPNNFIDNTHQIAPSPRADELFFLAAHYAPSESEEADAEQKEQPPVSHPFSVALLTEFDSFVGSSHITHRAKLASSGTLPPEFSLKYLVYNPEIEITGMRVGVDLFAGHAFAFLGFGPAVTQSLLVEMNQNKLAIRIQMERLKRRDELPLARNDLLKHLSDITTRAVGVNILADYQSCLSR